MRERSFLAMVTILILTACGGGDADPEVADTATTPTVPPNTSAESTVNTTQPTESAETTAASSPDTSLPADSGPVEITPVRLRLNWVIAGNHAPFFLAKQEGYWEACGLDVTLNAGQGSGDTAQLVGTGAEEFGLTDAVSITAGRSQGLPVKAIAVVYQDNPSSLVSYREEGITELSDVEGKRFGAVPGGSPYLLLQALFEQNGIDVDRVEEVSVPPPGIAQLKTGQVDFITFFGNEVASIEADISLLNVLYFRDLGPAGYGLALASSEDYIDANPQHAQCFVDGVRQGFEAAIADPEAALAALYAAAPETEQSPDVHQALLDGAFDFAGDDLLSQDLEGWTATQDVLSEAGVIDEPVDPETIFSEDFAG